jgi:hypothetical protein
MKIPQLDGSNIAAKRICGDMEGGPDIVFGLIAARIQVGAAG